MCSSPQSSPRPPFFFFFFFNPSSTKTPGIYQRWIMCVCYTHLYIYILALLIQSHFNLYMDSFKGTYLDDCGVYTMLGSFFPWEKNRRSGAPPRPRIEISIKTKARNLPCYTMTNLVNHHPSLQTIDATYFLSTFMERVHRALLPKSNGGVRPFISVPRGARRPCDEA